MIGHYNPNPEVVQIFKKYYKGDHKTTIPKVFLASMKQLQIKLIQHHYPKMDKTTKARADETLKWLGETT